MAHRQPALSLLAALFMIAGSPAAAQEPAQQELAWIEPIWFASVGVAGAPPVPGMLEQPAGWAPGDAVAVLLAAHVGPDAARERLIARLLEEGTAVLVLYTPRGVAAEVPYRPSNGAPATQEVLPSLLGALLALRRDTGAGLVVALGHGAASADEAALRAASEPTAMAHFGAAGPRFAAAAALGGPGRAAAFRPGATPPGNEGWSSRAPLLCAVLGAAVADLAGIQPAQSLAAATERGCSAALLRTDHLAIP